jgi:outer membrane protein
MKKIVSAALTGLALLATSALHAEEGPLLVRVRGVYISPADKSDANTAAGIPADAITVGTKTIPEVDFTYFLTKNFAAELILTYPQKLDVSLAGANIGSFKALPPTLTAQWHFLPDGPVDPYVGAGVNLTLISGVDLAGGTLDLSSSSVGVAGQLGLDIKVAPKWVINLDAKYVKLSADVKSAGGKISAVHVDPWLLGGGIGYRF